MSKLETQIKTDLKTALKNKDILATSVLRLLLADVKNATIAKIAALTDEEVMKMIAKAVKQRQDSIESYTAGGRQDLADKEKQEKEILQKYLPEQMSTEEITKIVDEIIKSTGTASAADFGKVMGAVMGKLKGRAEGQTVSKIVKEKLSR